MKLGFTFLLVCFCLKNMDAQTIDIQPVSQTDCNGNGVIFKVTASGTSLTYAWERKRPIDANFVVLATGMGVTNWTTASLSVSSVGSANNPNGSQYRVKVSSGAASVYSNIVDLSVSKVSGTLPNASICNGQTHRFKVSDLTIQGTPFSYQWQFNSGAGFANISTATTAQLDIPNASSANNGTYRCVITFKVLPENNNCTETSDDASLSVGSCILTINSQPTNQTDCQGNGVSFSTAATGAGTVSYQWYRKKPSDADFSLIDGAVSATLSVSSVGSTTNPHGSQYKCRVSDINGFLETNAATLSVNSLSGSIPSVSVCRGQAATLTANVTTVGSVQSQIWQVNNGSNWVDLSGQTASTLTFTNAQEANSGQYRIKYTFGITPTGTCTETSTEATLAVGSCILTINTQPISQTDCDGNGVSFSTAATGAGTVSYQWYRKKPSDADFSLIDGAVSATISVSSVGSATNPHGSQYKCRVSDINGFLETNAATLSVNAVSGSIPSVSVCRGQAATLTANVTTVGSVQSQIWQFNNGSTWVDLSDQTASTLTFTNAQEANSGQYRIKYTFGITPSGTCTETSAEATLAVGSCILTINTQPISQTDCDGNGVSFSTAATGAGTVSYQWYRKKPSDADFSLIDGAVSATISVSSVGSATNPHGSQYKCRVSDINGFLETNAATLSVNSLSGSIPSVSVCRGQAATLTANVTTVGSVQSQIWQVNNGSTWVDLSGQTASTLTFTNAQEANSGQYRIKYTFGITPTGTCTETSAEATLSVGSCILTINTQPTSQTDCDGNGVSFSTAATGAGTVSYQWFIKRPGQNSFASMNGETAAKLSLSNIGNDASPHRSLFYCLVKDDRTSLETATVQLNVNAIVGKFPDTGTCINSTLAIDISNYKITGTLLNIQWQYRPGTSGTWTDLQNSSVISGANSLFFSIKNAQLEHIGQYRVGFTFQNTPTETCTEYTETSNINIAKYPDPPIFENINQCQGSPPVTLKIPTLAYYGPVFYESLAASNGTTVPPKTNTTVPSLKSYFITQKSPEGCESQRKELLIRIHAKPLPPVNITQSPVIEPNCLNFKAEGDIVQWWPRSNSLTAIDPPFICLVGTFQYWASQTTRDWGCTSNRVLISGTVLPSFKILAQPQAQTDCKGNAVSFTLKAQGQGLLTYQWQIKSDTGFVSLADSGSFSGTKTAKLNISNIGLSHARHLDLFRCIVIAGDERLESTAAQLFVNSLDTQLLPKSLCVGQPLELNLGSFTGTISTISLQKNIDNKYQDFASGQTASYSAATTSLSGDYKFRVVFKNTAKETCTMSSNSFKVSVKAVPAILTDAKLLICSNTVSDLKIKTDSGQTALFFLNASDTIPIKPDLSNLAKSYYIAQSNGSCLGPKKYLDVLKVSPPAALPLQQLNLCAFTGDSPLTINAPNRLRWFSTATDTTPNTAPSVSTASERKLDYFIEQIDSVGCISERSKVDVNIAACLATQLSASCSEISISEVSGDKWYPFMIGQGVFCQINPKGQSLGTVTLSLKYDNASPLITKNRTHFLPRYFKVSSQNPFKQPISLRIYFSTDELKNLNLSEGKTTLPDSMAIIRYTGTNQNCSLDDNLNSDLASFLIYKNLSFSTLASGHHSILFSTDQLGEFGITSNHLVGLKSATAKTTSKAVELTIKVNAETQPGQFEISKNGSNLSTSPTTGQAQTFSFLDLFAQMGPNTYQIHYRNPDGTVKELNPITYTLKDSSYVLRAFPNPTSHAAGLTLFLRNIKPISTTLISSTGVHWPLVPPIPEPNGLFSQPLPALRPGVYVLEIIEDQGVIFHRRVVIQ